MPINSNNRVRLHPSMTVSIAKYAQMDDVLNLFYARLREHLESGAADGIFPCQMDQVDRILTGMAELTRQINQVSPVVAVTGRRALVAVNSFIFSRTVLEDEAFFFDRTLFMIGNQHSLDSSQASTRVHTYSRRELLLHSETHFASIPLMNRHLAEEILALSCDKIFDGILVEIGVSCPELGRIRIAVAPRVEAVIKDLLIQHQANTQRHHLCLMLHYFAPHAGNDSEMERKAAESELNHVGSMASHCQVLLLCEHRRDKLDEVVCSLRKYLNDSSVRLCHYVQWQWDGLQAAQVQIIALLDGELHKRSTALTKRAIREITRPLKLVFQLKQSIYLCRADYSRQRRSPQEYQKAVNELRKEAANLGKRFQAVVKNEIRDVSALVAQHFQDWPVRARVFGGILGCAAEINGSTGQTMESSLLQVVALEIREWNLKTRALDKADEAVQGYKVEAFNELCKIARGIPEIIVADDLTCFMENSEWDSEPKASIHGVIDDMRWMQLKAGRFESFAAALAAPLWLPLAAITMIIIFSVSWRETSGEKLQAELRGATDSFMDRLDASLIRSQFFEGVKERMNKVARRLTQFLENYCIALTDEPIPGRVRISDSDLMNKLAALEDCLQSLHGNLMMQHTEMLECDLLSRDECRELGIDIDIDDLEQLGERMPKINKPLYLVSNAVGKPQVLKLASKRQDSYNLLLEIDILKTVTMERHSSIIPWLGTVYFPKIRAIGFLTYKSDCDLWQFLQENKSQAVPSQHSPGTAEHAAAFAMCRDTCDQIFAGVRQLHSKQILHRDLKLENVLVDILSRTNPLRIVVKLCDFGMAKHEDDMSGDTFGGTNGYMAPELLRGRPLFSNKSDIFALGIVAWECFFGLRRFQEGPRALHEHRASDTWDFLVQSMTHTDPIQRPVIEQCQEMMRRYDGKPECSWNPLAPRLVQSLVMPSLPSLKESLSGINSASMDYKTIHE